jgi:hypothetical protein
MLPLVREAHEPDRHLERYIGTLMLHTVSKRAKIGRERDKVGENRQSHKIAKYY